MDVRRAADFTGCWRIALALVCLFARSGAAQTTLQSAIDMATHRNFRILAAQDDVHKAEATVKISKDPYIPSVILNGGIGDSYGITLNVPTIVTVNAQSLIYSASQRDYIRGAKIRLETAKRRLAVLRTQIEEEVVDAYLDVDHAQTSLAILIKETALSGRLFSTMQHRADAGIASQLDLRRTRYASVEVQLAQLEAEDRLAFFQLHLANLLPIPVNQLRIVPESIPTAAAFDVSGVSLDPQAEDDPSVLDAKASVAANELKAAGDKRLGWRPQISFASQYGRISPINGVTDFYNIHGNYNTFFGGVVFQFPAIDKLQRDRAKESRSDAEREEHSLQGVRADALENRLRIGHAIAELSARAQLADMDLVTAEEELKSVRAEAIAQAAGRLLATPMDEDRSMFHEQQLTLAASDAVLNLRKAQVSLLRQAGLLETRLIPSQKVP